MIHKILSISAGFTSLGSLYCTVLDLIELLLSFNKPEELVIVIAVVLWVPVIRFAVFLYLRFGTKFSAIFLNRHGKTVLRSVFWFCVVVTILNLVSKFSHYHELDKIIKLSVVYVLLLIFDYFETEKVIKKIQF